MSVHYLLLEFHISRPFSCVRLAFHCPLCVWQVKPGKEKRLEWRKPESTQQFEVVFRWVPYNLPHQAPASSHTWDKPKYFLPPGRARPHFRSSPLTPHPHYRQIHRQYLQSWPASSGSWGDLWLCCSHTGIGHPATIPKGSRSSKIHSHASPRSGTVRLSEELKQTVQLLRSIFKIPTPQNIKSLWWNDRRTNLTIVSWTACRHEKIVLLIRSNRSAFKILYLFVFPKKNIQLQCGKIWLFF